MKWFTYCGNVDTVQAPMTSWRKKASHAAKSWRSKSQKGLGLLLHSDDEADPVTDADVKALVADPLMAEFFPDGYYVLPADNGSDLIVTASTSFTVLPDRATPETPLLRIINDDEIYSVDLRQRYNNCRSLVKAVGCTHCPDQGVKCFKRDLSPEQVAYGTEFLYQPDDELAKELLKSRKTKIGPFTYVSPKLTIPENHVFVPSFRHYEDHDFGMIEENSESISEARKKAADGQQFKKKQCSKCPIRKACDSYRTCAGPYPPQEEMAQQILAEWESKLKDGPFEPWQFWVIARAGGREGKYLRKQVILQGLEHTSRGWRANVWRAKCDIRLLTSFTDYKDLQAVFNLPDEDTVKRDAPYWGRPESDQAVALYLLLTETDRSLRRGGGWGGDRYSIPSKDLTNDGVTIRFSGPRWIGYSHDIHTFADYRREVGYRFGVRQERVRLGGHSND